MCTFVIFPQTRDGPVIGNCVDDAVDWREIYSLAPLMQPRSCPNNMIYTTGVGGGTYEYELESAEIFPRASHNRCATLEEIECLVNKYAHFLTLPGHAGYLDLRTGETMVEERSLGDADVYRPDDGIAYNTYGGCRSPKLRQLCDQNSPLFAYYETRMATMTQIIDRHRDHLGVDTMWQVLLSRTPGGELCQHVETRPPGIHFITHQVTVLAPALGRFWSRSLADRKAPDEVDTVEQRFEPWL